MSRRKKIAGTIGMTLLFLILTQQPFSEKNIDVYAENVLDGVTVHTQFSSHAPKEPKEQDYLPDANSISYGILNENGDAEVEETYYLPKDECFKKYISLKNCIGEEICYTLLAFCNYKQIPLYIEGKNMPHCSVKVKHGERIQVPVEIRDLQEGKNDILFVWFIDTNKTLTQAELESINDNGNALELRCTVYVGESNTPNTDLELQDNLEYLEGVNNTITIQKEYGKDNMSLDKIALSKRHSQIYISAGNYEKNICKCVVLLLKDYSQVKIDGKPYKYLEIPSESHVSIPFSLDTKNMEQTELTAIFIEVPEKKEYGVTGTVAFSDRTFINLEGR